MSDIIHKDRFDALGGFVCCEMWGYGDSEYQILVLDVQTGCMTIDVCGRSQLCHFDDVKCVIDQDCGRHDPDEFWIEGLCNEQ